MLTLQNAFKSCFICAQIWRFEMQKNWHTQSVAIMPLVVHSILTWILNFKALLLIPFLQPFPPLWEN